MSPGARGAFVPVLTSASPFVSHAPALPAMPSSPSARPGLSACGPGASGRAGLEAFIRAVYREHYGAEVRSFAPTLVGLRDEDGTLVAAAGYRAADPGPLFLERYLFAPVQSLLAAGGAHAPDRARIVEVGHLASVRPGAGRRLFAPLALHLAALGFDWVVGTLTEELRMLFARLGIEPTALGVADPSLLGAEAAAWGCYYDHRPMVLAGRIGPALQTLAARARPTKRPS